MIIELFLVGLFSAALLLALGWFVNRGESNKGNHFLIGGALILIIIGLFSVVDAQGLEVQTYGGCENASYENSYVWEGYCNVTDLFPETLIAYADGVNIEDGTYTSGTLLDTHEIDGDYYVVKENGASFNITWNFTWSEYECPEHFHWTGRYDAPANREFDWYSWNWTSSAWMYVGTGSPDVVASGADSSELLDSGCTTDFLNPITNQIRMKMDTENSGTGQYYLYTDLILLDTESETSYAISNKILNCTRDQYNTTREYGACYKETTGFNLSQMIAVVLILIGLGTMLGVVSWSKTEDLYTE